MLILSVFYCLFVLYNCSLTLRQFLKTKKAEKTEIVDDFTDLMLSLLLLLVGLAAEKIIAYNWVLFGIPLLLHIAGKLYLRKLTGHKINV